MAVIWSLVLLAEEPALAGAPCSAIGEKTIVLTTVDSWRTLTTRTGARLTPAGIADFSVLSGEAETPEAKRALNDRLTEAFTALLGKPLSISTISPKADRHGRQPVLIFSGDEFVQAGLVADGLAIAFPAGSHLPCAHRLFAAERLARARTSGFWALPQAWITAPTPEAFSDRMGRFTILEGRVVSVGTRKRTTYLNFGGRWASDVTVEIPADQRDQFGGDASLEALTGMRIRVRGFPIEKSGPMLDVRNAWQIEKIR